jgi:Ca2+-binding RTX toxin-like protein
MGIYQEFLVPISYRIFADAGTGNDSISLLSGSDKREATRNKEVPFTLDAELYGGDGNDQLDTGAGNDYIDGGLGNDTINARSGDDIVFGGSADAIDSNNSLDGGIGTDVLIGGPGRDIVNGGPGRDLLLGGGGDDNLAGGPGMPPSPSTDDAVIRIQDKTDILIGGEGDDILTGAFDTDYLFGDELPGLPSTSELNFETDRQATVQASINLAVQLNCQADLSGTGYDSLIGGDGDDFLFGGGGNDRLEGEKGNDTMCGNGGDDVLTGGTGADELYGNVGHDLLNGDQGNDFLYGGDNDDDLIGGEGQDTLYGQQGNDILLGDEGDVEGHPEEDVCRQTDGDTCVKQSTIPLDHGTDTTKPPEFVNLMTTPSESAGVSYDDWMYGGSGNDFMFGEFGIDHMYGEDNDDYMEGNAGNDLMEGGAGSDHMFGGQDVDIMRGGTQDDFMWGNSADDEMYGNDGNDTMYGNIGDDYIEGNSGGDTIYGGADQDDILGGSKLAGSPDTGDWLYGEEGDDRITGDNALITASGVTLLDVELLPGAINVNWYGDDHIEGNAGNDRVWGQGGEDEIYGGDGDDYIEGNHASDEIYGDAGDDDIIGGSSPVFSGLRSINYTDQSTQVRAVPLGDANSVTVPLGDTIHGGDGSDVIMGDNGIVGRPYGNTRQSYQLEAATFGDTSPQHVTSGTGERVMRTVSMVNTSAGFTAGSDLIFGDAGEDELYGQFDETGQVSPAIGDELNGGDGQDLLIGDQGVAVARVLTGETQSIKSNPPFLKDVILLKGTLYWEVNLSPNAADGNDRLLGGNGSDFLHGNGGYDLLNGNAGNDRLFGDDGNDALWGGPDHDHLWGGAGNDFLDVLPRASRTDKKGNKITTIAADPREWFPWATVSDYSGIDYMYGGLGQDAMQADVYPTGPAAGDRMIDWIGVYNIYYLCGPQYGEFVITRSHSPSVIDFLAQLAAGDGALNPGTASSSGYSEISIVYQPDFQTNSHPPHPDTPGHFTCP